MYAFNLLSVTSVTFQGHSDVKLFSSFYFFFWGGGGGGMKVLFLRKILSGQIETGILHRAIFWLWLCSMAYL